MFGKVNNEDFDPSKVAQISITHKVSALFDLLSDMLGSEHLILKAGKYDALELMESEQLNDRIVALERIVYEDPSIQQTYTETSEILAAIADLTDTIAEAMAKNNLKKELDNKVENLIQERQQEYLRELQAEVLKKDVGSDNAQTLKKYAELERLDQKKLAVSALDLMRPTKLSEIVGQQRALKSLVSKLSSPFPQHMIIYGPPGVGKTTAARLALEYAKQRPYTPFVPDAPFIEVDGTTLRWDPREVTNPLLGSVHDPIYQGARKDLADGAIPEPKLGLVTKAHGGVLFIDEIGELDPLLQNKLLKVLEDKRVMFDSAYYDPDDPHIPKYIKKLFDEGAPADFILIGATTKAPSEINPALRSRCTEIFFDPLTQEDIIAIVTASAQRLAITLDPQLAKMIAQYTMEGRQAVRLLADAYSAALFRCCEAGKAIQDVTITQEDLTTVINAARLTPMEFSKAGRTYEVGKVFGLGVSGFVGSVIEIEAVAFPASRPGEGVIRFNDTAGTMAKDSVFNAASVYRLLTGENVHNYDLHVNVVGGGRIDGPSAGAAILLAIYSAIKQLPLPQDIAITGEISLQGKLKPVGGIPEKIYGAKRAGMRKVILPIDNLPEAAFADRTITTVGVKTASELLNEVFEQLNYRCEVG